MKNTWWLNKWNPLNLNGQNDFITILGIFPLREKLKALVSQ